MTISDYETSGGIYSQTTWVIKLSMVSVSVLITSYLRPSIDSHSFCSFIYCPNLMTSGDCRKILILVNNIVISRVSDLLSRSSKYFFMGSDKAILSRRSKYFFMGSDEAISSRRSICYGSVRKQCYLGVVNISLWAVMKQCYLGEVNISLWAVMKQRHPLLLYITYV